MGLIRKTLAIGTVGIVRPNSRKQRVAKAGLKELKKQTGVLERAEAAAAEEQLRQQYLAERRAEMLARQSQTPPDPRVIAAPQPVQAPPAGWYQDADRAHLLRWWDGSAWTEQTAPRG